MSNQKLMRPAKQYESASSKIKLVANVPIRGSKSCQHTVDLESEMVKKQLQEMEDGHPTRASSVVPAYKHFTRWRIVANSLLCLACVACFVVLIWYVERSTEPPEGRKETPVTAENKVSSTNSDTIVYLGHIYETLRFDNFDDCLLSCESDAMCHSWQYFPCNPNSTDAHQFDCLLRDNFVGEKRLRKSDCFVSGHLTRNGVSDKVDVGLETAKIREEVHEVRNEIHELHVAKRATDNAITGIQNQLDSHHSASAVPGPAGAVSAGAVSAASPAPAEIISPTARRAAEAAQARQASSSVAVTEAPVALYRVAGKISNAMTGRNMWNCEVAVFDRFTHEKVKVEVTDHNGLFALHLPVGAWQFVISHPGYSSVTHDTKIPPEPLSWIRYALSPVLGQDQVRIVLQWRRKPSVLVGELKTPTGCRLDAHSSLCLSGRHSASLDHSSSKGYGPNTMTISRPNFLDQYDYKVLTPSGSPEGTMAKASPLVKVYLGKDKVFTFKFGKIGRLSVDGQSWHVFSYKALFGSNSAALGKVVAHKWI